MCQVPSTVNPSLQLTTGLPLGGFFISRGAHLSAKHLSNQLRRKELWKSAHPGLHLNDGETEAFQGRGRLRSHTVSWCQNQTRTSSPDPQL